MTDIALYLIDNYYSKYPAIKVPHVNVLEHAIKEHKDHIVIIRDDKIKGVAVYLTLSDETYAVLENIDFESADDVMAEHLFNEKGKNVHFIILAADALKTILKGLSEVIEKEHPRTVSWFNPDHTKLHTRRF